MTIYRKERANVTFPFSFSLKKLKALRRIIFFHIFAGVNVTIIIRLSF